MQIIVADPCGFCYGVKRAIDIAQMNVKGYNTSIATLGEIVHNPRVVESLAQKGVQCKETLADFSAGDTVIFRSHGAAPQIYEEAEQKGLKIIDATCPHVRKAQKTAAALSKEGRFVIIIGEKRHPEVQSIKAWAGKDSLVIETADDARRLLRQGSLTFCFICRRRNDLVTTKWKGPSVQPLLNVRKQQGNLLETVTRSLSLAEKTVPTHAIWRNLHALSIPEPIFCRTLARLPYPCLPEQKKLALLLVHLHRRKLLRRLL